MPSFHRLARPSCNAHSVTPSKYHEMFLQSTLSLSPLSCLLSHRRRSHLVKISTKQTLKSLISTSEKHHIFWRDGLSACMSAMYGQLVRLVFSCACGRDDCCTLRTIRGPVKKSLQRRRECQQSDTYGEIRFLPFLNHVICIEITRVSYAAWHIPICAHTISDKAPINWGVALTPMRSASSSTAFPTANHRADFRRYITLAKQSSWRSQMNSYTLESSSSFIFFLRHGYARIFLVKDGGVDFWNNSGKTRLDAYISSTNCCRATS